VLCDAFCSHTALPRAKGVHQARDSAVLFSKTNGLPYLKPRVGTADGEGRGRRSSSTEQTPSAFCPSRPRPSVRHRCQVQKNADVK